MSFADGNGRTGRLWQSLILGQLHPLFEHLPVENMVFANQQQYYDAIAASTHTADSIPNKVPNKVPNKSEQSILSSLRKDGTLTMAKLAKKSHLSESGVKKILVSLKASGYIVRIGSNKTGYWKVINSK